METTDGGIDGTDVGGGSMPGAASDEARYCDQCGEPVAMAGHDRCTTRRALEPPRFCPRCRRRMVVQVVPLGWTARCSAHGEASA